MFSTIQGYIFWLVLTRYEYILTQYPTHYLAGLIASISEQDAMIETCIVQSVFHLEIRLNNRKWTLRYHILNMYHKMYQL